MGRFFFWLFLAITLTTAGYFVVVMLQIHMRISRNGEVGRELVESLHKEFPVATFSCAVAHETDIIFITAIRGVDDKNKKDVERWLRATKDQWHLRQEIWFQFEKDADRPEADREIYKI